MGADVIAVDWTDVGRNSFYTFTDISLNPNYKYYFSIKAFDKLEMHPILKCLMGLLLI